MTKNIELERQFFTCTALESGDAVVSEGVNKCLGGKLGKDILSQIEKYINSFHKNWLIKLFNLSPYESFI